MKKRDVGFMGSFYFISFWHPLNMGCDQKVISAHIALCKVSTGDVLLESWRGGEHVTGGVLACWADGAVRSGFPN